VPAGEICAVCRERVAVLAVYSVEFVRVEVRMMRAALLDPPSRDRGRAFVIGMSGLGDHLADGLLTDPYPDRRQRNKLIRSHSGLEPDRVAAALSFWARMLRGHAPNLLRGDTSILDTWERGRVAEVVTLYVPRTATASQEAAAVARTHAVLAARSSSLGPVVKRPLLMCGRRWVPTGSVGGRCVSPVARPARGSAVLGLVAADGGGNLTIMSKRVGPPPRRALLILSWKSRRFDGGNEKNLLRLWIVSSWPSAFRSVDDQDGKAVALGHDLSMSDTPGIRFCRDDRFPLDVVRHDFHVR
jgi:hypothetical protein